MEEYREAQRQKWLQEKQAKETDGEQAASTSSAAGSSSGGGAAAGASASANPPAAAAASSSASRAAAAAATAAAADDTGPKPNARRVHILPVGQSPETNDQRPGGAASAPPGAVERRLELLAPALRQKRGAKETIKTGLLINSSGHEFIVVKSDPEECVLSTETDYFVEGDPIKRFEKVQFICLWDFESGNSDQDPSILFKEYISPYFRSMSDSGEAVGNIVAIGETMKIFDLEFQVMAAEPTPPEIGLIDTNTMVYVDWDGTPEFEKIHIVPFQDTLPHAYEFDVFNDYLKPYLTKNKHSRFGVNDQFTYQGVQFKVVCCEPNGPARIGRNTTIYCEGVLHPSLRNLLPPELLEQLSHLPPGLQMLLLNTEALAGGYEERLIEVQEMLSRRRGLTSDTIDRVDKFRWEATGAEEAQSQCMVCLANFEEGDEVRRLPCGHIFHAPCIDEWLRRCTDCPICKANVDRAVRQY